ncbi:MAG: helix-turn-helix transcriptional regulator [Gemmataceae bacterium]|nr:helix-turn-helix transcriptional regulator [Gemmataceae bacterium]
MGKSIQRKTERSSEEVARLKALREQYQREKPSIADLEAQGATFTTMGEFMMMRGIAHELKQERERQGLTLAQMAERTGMDAATLSRIETRTAGNPTVGTLSRIARALGKDISCRLVEMAPA